MNARSHLPLYAGIICALITFFVSAPPRTAQADIGWPPLNPSGSSLEPPEGANTNVRMVSEEVTLTVEAHQRPVTPGSEESPAYWMRGLVEAEFQMRNLGSVDEAFDVWFPLAASMRYPGMLPYTPENIVQDFKVWVDGLPTATKQVIAPDLSDPKQDSTWARFPMTFPAGKDVIVHVNYTVFPSGRRPFGGFEYILQTGAGWKDTIGEALITVYLPDTVTSENLSQSGRSVEGLPLAPNPSGYTIENNTIRWRLTDFEPTAQDNIFVDVLEPERYRELVRARARVQASPNSADTQLQMAQAAQNAVMVVKSVGNHGGGAKVAEEANAAFRRALELAPNRSEIYIQYAKWLMRTSGWTSLMFDGTCPAELCDVVRRGLLAFPTNPDLTEIDQEIRTMQEDYAYNAMLQAQTQTATAQTVMPSPTPTSPSPTRTPIQLTVTAAPTEAAASQGPGGLCPGAALPLATLALVGISIWRKNRPTGL